LHRRYYNGNDIDPVDGSNPLPQPGQEKVRGFGHVGFLVNDLDAACEYLESEGVSFKKKPAEGSMRGLHVFPMSVFHCCAIKISFSFSSGLAFAYDPDNYW
jgi:catechol 2,3-dioxygenase-like lactoylglutathione lyase family enzyme